jgi:hypothetical protein
VKPVVFLGACLLTRKSPLVSRSPTPQMPSSEMTLNCALYDERRTEAPGRLGAAEGGGRQTSLAPLACFLSGTRYFLKTEHRPKPRSSDALFMISASSMS